MHSTTFTIAEKSTIVARLFGLHPIAVAVLFKAMYPHVPEVIAVDIALIILAPNARASRDMPVHQDTRHTDSSRTLVEIIPYLAFPIAQKTLARKTNLPILLPFAVNEPHQRFKFLLVQKEFGVNDVAMFMVSDQLRIGVVTGHIPLKDVPSSITVERIVGKLRLMTESLKRDFGVVEPKIAVLGLNPHCGDGGLLGDEEEKIILPAVKAANAEGIMAFGPYSPDGYFGLGHYAKFDATLAMYHDQGLAPFKALAFEDGVNFTAGLPIVRTSPDHGTAFEMAGRDEADPHSMMSSIYTAIDIYRKRLAFDAVQEGKMNK